MDQCGGQPNRLDDVAKSSLNQSQNISLLPVPKTTWQIPQSAMRQSLDLRSLSTSNSHEDGELGARVPPPNSVSERPQDVQGCLWKHS